MRKGKGQLDREVRRLNREAGNLEEPEWNFIGRFQISCAYGGYQLQRVCSEHGAVRNLTSGYVSASELFGILHAMEGRKL